MDRRAVKKIIKAYVVDLSKYVRPEKVILFGSYARGMATEDSDIDLLIISPDFKKLSDKKRFSILWDARKNPLTRKVAMDLLGLTPEEFENTSPLTTLSEIKKEGVVIYSD